MPNVAIKPDPANTRTVYVTATDRRRTCKSQGATVYGMTPAQVIKLLREAITRHAREQAASQSAPAEPDGSAGDSSRRRVA